MTASQGFQCQFQDSVPEDLYCKQCSLVARKLTITSCCGESYCNACILSVQQAKKPCPECEEESFEILQQIKFQKKILSLQAFCPLKEKGCGWCGKLDQLDAHLDPDEGDCEHAIVDCPLQCGQKVARKDIIDHTANECVKRDYDCPYCSYTAVYEEISTTHLLECGYYPLPCPNHCGVTYKRATMEDHMKICPLQEVECEFQHVGCEAKFRREEEEEHMREKSQTHLTMMVSASFTMHQNLNKNLKELEEKFEAKLVSQQKSFNDTIELKFRQQLQQKEDDIQIQKKRLREVYEKQIQEHQETIETLKKEATVNALKIRDLEKVCYGLHTTFTMTHFSVEKAKDKYSDWKSPAMNTHMNGYKFCIGVDANGCVFTRGNSVNAELWAMEGDHDDQLKWPVMVSITLDLINHHKNGENKTATVTTTWEKPALRYEYTKKRFNSGASDYCFIKHAELDYSAATSTHFLKDDTLHFKVTNITVL